MRLLFPRLFLVSEHFGELLKQSAASLRSPVYRLQSLLTCSPKTDPVTMRVRPSQMGRRMILDEEKTHPGADRSQATPGGRRTGRRGLGPRDHQETRHKRGDLPPLAQPL